jgi:hypothetical protein
MARKGTVAGSAEKEREAMAGRSLAEDLLLFHLVPTAA